MTNAIHAIEKSSVHRIQSGQVIVDLCSVVKELVENSLDAGATAIDIRFRSHGLDAVEVQDNGTGIGKENYESIALKHYTSKLRSYEDLTTLNTFGFRGEALSSLCALADVHIFTATQDEAPRGSRLDFEPSGQLKGTQVVAAQRGTIVVVDTIFKGLPVRRQELTKNIKREYSKVLNLLQAYACVSIGVKFTTSNVVGKKKAPVFATHANKTVRENIANVFGQKTVAALTTLDLEFEMQSTAPRAAQKDENRAIQIQGHVSKPIVGEGRQTPDRQMFFVNSRPCNLPQISKTMNEVYRSYNSNQSPFIFANLIIDTSAYDVNVSPDKRQILLHDQGALLESLKAALIARFDDQQQTVPQTKKTTSKLPAFQSPTFSSSPSTSSLTAAVDRLRPRDNAGSSSSPREPSRAFASPIPHGSPRKQVPPSTPLSPAPKGLMYQFQSQSPAYSSSKARNEPDFRPASRLLEEEDGPGRSSSSTRGAPQAASTDPPISSEDFDLAEMAASAADSSSRLHLENFNRRMRALQQEDGDEEGLDPSSPRSRSEAPIPSIHSSPAKPLPGVVPNAFERMRPIRAEKQTATITIGDTTTVQDIGPSWRGERPRSLLGSRKAKPANPQFTSSLRAFLAPDSQANDQGEADSSEASPDTERFAPEWPRRGPNKPSRGLRNAREPRHPPDPAQSGQTLGSAAPQESPDSEVVSSDEELVNVSEGIMTHRESITSEANEGNEEAQPESDPDGASSSDEEWLDEDAKRAREDARVAKMIREAEAKAARPSTDHVKRAHHLLRGGHRDATTRLVQTLDDTIESLERQTRALAQTLARIHATHARQRPGADDSTFADASAEDRLTLSVSKADFNRMRIVGQFNLGFVLAVRPGTGSAADELFIIDQHASDEKCNFERLSATTTLNSQRLVHPLPLELTAVEREIVAQHGPALDRNGFVVKLHDSDDSRDDSDTHAGPSPRATLLALPASKETTFSPADLAELLALLPDDAAARPSRVRRLLAMRACRSSIMIGRALTGPQMVRVVRSLGGLEKPWNCPHGRPTMRHVVSLGGWETWKEGREGEEWRESDRGEEEEDEDQKRYATQRWRDRGKGSKVDWAGWVKAMNGKEGENDRKEDGEGEAEAEEEAAREKHAGEL